MIAAVILGGTSLFGGTGTVIGSVLGTLLVGLINNGLTLFGLELSQQEIIRGANHHFGCRPRPQIEKSSSRGSEPQVKPKKEER